MRAIDKKLLLFMSKNLDKSAKKDVNKFIIDKIDRWSILTKITMGIKV